ncbi:16S rRNA (guanine(966)-N(2))-methyltransferase RsmD [Marilutibacter alkalisoli]|uniref:Ribosomal RNA small subunit methyltransferase D n=1 Tax=Marilutibacter alkalisoli TaxID=2591633 RepID=A0A514BPZ6_9GAMM|nr:16S rRNA (guanine(966)-N(2))-methyltransferase RsmD [Lysobacter alkalisoli]QDH69460.1 16S rRNA (guanine(966)-N(2))-methyltransferase RsmD [Lysobacter alkalisoli]
MKARHHNGRYATRARATAPGRVRLIGGRWRGTRLEVPEVAGLRPTSDRVRETLFNWLAPALPGARVLDLFAGSGALGLEAVSRGAASAVLVERDRVLAQALRTVAGRLPGGEVVKVAEADARQWLQGQANASFDIAFVDPPFAEGLWETVLPVLSPLLAADGWLYVESRAETPAAPPAGWALHRDGRTREVHHALYRRGGPY